MELEWVMKMQKIMIVEDDEVIALAIQKHLETWNYEVEVVDDFEHVLDLYLQKQPELILYYRNLVSFG